MLPCPLCSICFAKLVGFAKPQIVRAGRTGDHLCDVRPASDAGEGTCLFSASDRAIVSPARMTSKPMTCESLSALAMPTPWKACHPALAEMGYSKKNIFEF